jgi:thiopeptide-type bacteriocin biosynthesis protein
MDRLLDDLGMNLDDKCTLLFTARSAFRHEFGMRHDTSRKLAEKYRRESALLRRLLDSSESDEYSAAREVLSRRSQRNSALIGRLPVRANDGVDSIATSLLHMHANRILRSGHRAQEAVLYDFLHRHYEASRGRERGKKARPVEQPNLVT